VRILKELSACLAELRIWGKEWNKKEREGGTLSRVFLQSVWKGMIAKELEETVAFECDPSVRNRLISKELKGKFALNCKVSEKTPLAFVRGKKELEEERLTVECRESRGTAVEGDDRRSV
jgi:hypothetical protein